MARQERRLEMSDPWSPVAQRLRDLRQATGLTYRELAQRSNYSTQALSMTAAAGHGLPAWDKVFAFITGCGVTDPTEVTQWRQAYDRAHDAVAAAAVSAASDAAVGVVAPEMITTWAEFATGLRTVRVQTGWSYQELAQESRRQLAKSTISNLLSGRIEPSWTTVETFLTVCGRRTAVDLGSWLAAWHRLRAGGHPDATADSGPGADGGQPTPLRRMNEDMRSDTPPAAAPGNGNDGRPATIATAQAANTAASGERVQRTARPSAVMDRAPRRGAPSAWFGASSRGAGSADMVRTLTRDGALADLAATMAGDDRARLTGGAYAIVWPVVFQHLTRGLEIRRGHPDCAASVHGLRPECLDRFQDDVEAVVQDLLHSAKAPIANLEGWIIGRLNAATVDGHRRRRGERGALQRPRLPSWLATALHHDRWLTALALEILVWVGSAATAGTSVWPLGAWAELRGRVTGDLRADDSKVMSEIETVLAAMRQKPTWYENFVERPLGRKQPSVAPAWRFSEVADPERMQLPLVDRHDVDDTHLVELASAAVAAIEDRLRRGEEPATAVQSVLQVVFGGGTGAEDVDRIPGTGPTAHERAFALVADPVAINRITEAALRIIRR